MVARFQQGCEEGISKILFDEKTQRVLGGAIIGRMPVI